MGTSSELLEESLFPNTRFPLVIQPRAKGIDLAEWFLSHRVLIDRYLGQYGAVLFRGFAIDSVAKFDRFVHACSSRLMTYTERSSPRSQLGKSIYTSTDYPAKQVISPHNEHSYAIIFPLRLFFCCETPPSSGGQTPMVDCRNILQHIPAAILKQFREKKWMYVRNFSLGVGLPWSTAFQTLDRSEVEAHCNSAAIEYEWRKIDELRTRQVRNAIARHPRTGHLVWFNHVAFFHVSTLEPSIREMLLQNFTMEELPNNTYYGDGSEIDSATLDIVREAYRRETTCFEWEKGDAIVVDNMLIAHARMPYTGNRRILFAMAEPTLQDEVIA